jgi:hypothetical protein
MGVITSTVEFVGRLVIGQDYEDFVVPVLWARGWPTYVYRSKEAQWACGESLNNIEVKLDNGFRKSGRLFIETRERRSADGSSEWRRSGIYDEHNPRLYVIGDYETVYVLGVRWLRAIADRLESGSFPKDAPTAECVFLPLNLAEKYAVDVIEVLP